jgi:hypothetical protein
MIRRRTEAKGTTMPMNRRAVLAGLLATGLAAPARAQRSAVGAALLQFEEAVTWEAVSAEWRGLRPGWVQRTGAAAAPQDLAALMVLLETNMGWHAVQPSWRGRRDPWIAEARAARSEADVARLLLELEEVTLWSAVDGSWRATRPGWVAQLGAVARGAGASPTK